ncbi:MAG: hypothetical protein KBE91_04145 [Bacteroidia bacterium]|nr:hypothetical protein [Bacteroidia bacterium]MBP9688778.1 hypothetical protein [Bacteroidia bacterium]
MVKRFILPSASRFAKNFVQTAVYKSSVVGTSSAVIIFCSSAAVSISFSASCFLLSEICCFSFSILLNPLFGNGGGGVFILGTVTGSIASALASTFIGASAFVSGLITTVFATSFIGSATRFVSAFA